MTFAPFPEVDRGGVSLVCFGLTTLSMATVGVLVPLVGAVTATTGASSAQFGLALSLFSLPSAFGSILSGHLCDRFGARLILLSGGLVALAADALIFLALSPWILALALLVAGIAFSMTVVAAPALIMALLHGGARSRSLSLWVTYAPVGIAVGLLLATPFIGKVDWRTVLVMHGSMLALTSVAGVLIVPTSEGGAKPLVPARGNLMALLREGTILRLGVALALPAAMSYGTSLLAPSYIARVHHVGLGAAALWVALAKMAVVLLGGLATGWVLSRAMPPGRMFNLLWVLGLGGQVMLFHPLGGVVAGILGYGLWLFAYAGISAVAMTMLPIMFPDQDQMGLANGMVSQLISCASFLAPIVYFLPLAWWVFPAIALGGLACSVLVLPHRAAA